MNIETMDQMIVKRAHNRVQTKINAFEKAVCEAFYAFDGNTWTGMTDCRKAVLVKMSEGAKKGWPAEIWREEEKRVREEVMAAMDEVQKMHLSPAPKADDFQPAAEGGAS